MLSVLTAATAGCGDPRHQEAIARREANLAHVLRVMREHEAGRDLKMAHTLRVIEERHQEDLQAGRRIPAVIDRAIQDDFNRPATGSRVWEAPLRDGWEGDSANFERTLPHVLY